MAIKFPGSAAPQPAAGKPAAGPTQAERDEAFIREQDDRRRAQAPAESAPTPIRPEGPTGPRPPAAPSGPSRGRYGGEAGVGGEVPTEDAGGGGNLPFANTFEPLPGRSAPYKFLCAVEAVTHWENGPSVHLRVRVGEERGREFRWDQFAPPYCHTGAKAEQAMVHWRRRLFTAYAAGGWTHEPRHETGWPGWPRNGAGDYVPPYADFFVTSIDGLAVPILLHATIQVDAGYEKYPKIVAVRPHTVGDSLVQAPMPRKVTPWIAEMHRWSGVPDDFTIAPRDGRAGYTVASTKLTWDQVPRGVGGLLGLKDCTAP